MILCKIAQYLNMVKIKNIGHNLKLLSFRKIYLKKTPYIKLNDLN